VRVHFDLRPAAIIHNLNLRRPIYLQTAAYGHFGRPDLDLPSKKTGKAAELRSGSPLPNGLRKRASRERCPFGDPALSLTMRKPMDILPGCRTSADWDACSRREW
jgi:hypothetical protein